MKKVLFDREISIVSHRTHVRKDYPGYLFSVSSLPGIDLVVCRGSKTIMGTDDFKFHPGVWRVHDRTTGYQVSAKGRTREEAVASAIAHLYNFTPESYWAKVRAIAAERASKLLQKYAYADRSE